MNDSVVEFPGFQIYSHRDEFEFRSSMSRLQKRAPCPLQVEPTMISYNCNGTHNSMLAASNSSSNSDPIPLLSPLVVLDSTCIRQENTAKSH
ncbi:hypothetical protein Lal_00030980 [Lupinus albus]|nr:hypothetical protein Lal_00030980 [Lupinus albus]